MDFRFLHQYPFLRLAIPFMIGIGCGDWLFFHGWERSVTPLACGWAAGGMLLLFLFRNLNFARRHWFGLVLAITLLCGGAWYMQVRLSEITGSVPGVMSVYKAQVISAPEEKKKTWLVRADIQRKEVLLYLAKDSLSGKLRSGDVLYVNARLSMPSGYQPELGNFNYATYLLYKGVFATAYVPSGHWLKAGHEPLAWYMEKAEACKAYLKDKYRELGFEGDTLAVLSALTIGEKDDLSEDVRESYSVAGVSHVLALSGLHIGILYAFLAYGFRKIPIRNRVFTFLWTVAILFVLWGFAFLTGFSPSVVRSVFMFSLLAVAGLLSRRSASLNTLSVAAFVLLLYRPMWLFDVGFQLSFAAVAAIVCLYKQINNWLPALRKIPVVSHFWGWTAVSVAAQAGTAPLIACYFASFPVYFLLGNWVIVPLVTLILYLAVGMLLLTPFAFLQQWLAVCLKWLIGFQNGFVCWIQQLPGASIEWNLDAWELIPAYSFLFCLVLYCRSHEGKFVVAGLSVMLLWLLFKSLSEFYLTLS